MTYARRPPNIDGVTLPDDDAVQPISWKLLGEHTEVMSADAQHVGVVHAVLGDEHLDVFEGVVIDVRRGPGGLRLVDADQIGALQKRRVELRITAAEAKLLPAPTANPAVMRYHPDERLPSAPRQWLTRAWDLLSGRR